MKKKFDFKKLLSSENNMKLIIICGVLGILLLFISGIQTDEKKSTEINYSVENYKVNLQNDLQETLYKIDGVGEVNVLLTIENSIEGIYLENNSTKTKEIEPIVRGVVVVCQGGDEPLVIERVLNAVTKALNISKAKVCITKLKE